MYGTLNVSLPAADHMTTAFEYQIVLRWAWFIEILARNVGLDKAADYGTSDGVSYQIKKCISDRVQGATEVKKVARSKPDM